MKMTLLLFDTSTEILSVSAAEIRQGNIVKIDTRQTKTGLNHTGFLVPAVQELLLAFQFPGGKPDAVACSLGPGSFTGLRIGLCTAKGLAEGWNCPLIGLENLRAMAQTAVQSHPNDTDFLPVIDARKKKFYIALYRRTSERLMEIVPPQDLTPAQISSLLLDNPGTLLCGYQPLLLREQLDDAWKQSGMVIQENWMEALVRQAEEKFAAEDFLPPEAGPYYLRLSEAEENLHRNFPNN